LLVVGTWQSGVVGEGEGEVKIIAKTKRSGAERISEGGANNNKTKQG